MMELKNFVLNRNILKTYAIEILPKIIGNISQLSCRPIAEKNEMFESKYAIKKPNAIFNNAEIIAKIADLNIELLKPFVSFKNISKIPSKENISIINGIRYIRIKKDIPITINRPSFEFIFIWKT